MSNRKRNRTRVLSEVEVSHSNQQSSASSSPSKNKKRRPSLPAKRTPPNELKTTPLAEVLGGESLVTKTLSTCGVQCSEDRSMLYCSEPYMLPRQLEDALQQPGSSEEFLEEVTKLFESSSIQNLLFAPLGEINAGGHDGWGLMAADLTGTAAAAAAAARPPRLSLPIVVTVLSESC